MFHRRQIHTKQQLPYTTGYRPDMDMFPELDANQLKLFQEMIVCLRWSIELGRADITTEVVLLSRYLDLPRRGHFDQCFNVYAYLNQHQYPKLVTNPANTNIKDHYPDSFNDKEEWF